MKSEEFCKTLLAPCLFWCAYYVPHNPESIRKSHFWGHFWFATGLHGLHRLAPRWWSWRCRTLRVGEERDILDEELPEECVPRGIRHVFEVRHSPLVGSGSPALRSIVVRMEAYATDGKRISNARVLNLKKWNNISPRINHNATSAGCWPLPRTEFSWLWCPPLSEKLLV